MTFVTSCSKRDTHVILVSIIAFSRSGKSKKAKFHDPVD